MGVRVVEGQWEKVAKKVKLAGRKVRVVFQDDSDTVTLAQTATTSGASAASSDPWLKQLIEFSNSHKRPDREIDLNRDRLFEELQGDRG
jgi:hypothetical protein